MRQVQSFQIKQVKKPSLFIFTINSTKSQLPLKWETSSQLVLRLVWKILILKKKLMDRFTLETIIPRTSFSRIKSCPLKILRLKLVSTSKTSFTCWLLSIIKWLCKKVSPTQNWTSLYSVTCHNAILSWTLSANLLSRQRRHLRSMTLIQNAYWEKQNLLLF